MKNIIAATLAVACVALLATACDTVAPSPTVAVDFAEGVRAYEQQDYEAALREFRPLAEHGNVGAQWRLGVMYGDGRGVDKDYRQAEEWFRMAAERGHMGSQRALGSLYMSGIHDEIIPRDLRRSAQWFRRAAEQDDASAQYVLGLMYDMGAGLPQSQIRAYVWHSLAATHGLEPAREAREELRMGMTDTQIDHAQQFSGELYDWIAEGADGTPPRLHLGDAGAEPPNSRGTGFLIGHDRTDDPPSAWIVTNNHVIEDCDSERVTVQRGDSKSYVATVRHGDAAADLALLKTASEVGKKTATFSESQYASRAERVWVAGYPHRWVLPSDLNVVDGVVSALAGTEDDPRYLQITAPVQMGNSGGPLLDVAGNVIGVVKSKINALAILEKTGDLPQLGAYAIKAGLVRGFLDIHRVDYRRRPSDKTLDSEQLDLLADSFTVAIGCLH